MPGPGGGARGGGGGRSSRGGFSGGTRGGFSGGSRGGSFGGGNRPNFHPGGPPRHGGWHHRPHYGGWHRPVHYSGGGCSTGLIVVLVLCLLIVFGMIYGSESVDSRYDEEAIQDLADRQYAEAFGGSSAYEDNLLISVLVDEDHYSYYYIAWVGDHIATDINFMLGGNDTVLGQAMESCINQSSYKYSLDSNLAQVLEILTKEVKNLGLADSFTCNEDHVQVPSRLINDSALPMTEETVNHALAAFTEATGIPVVIAVDDINDLGKTGEAFTGSGSVTSIALIAIVAVLGVAVVAAVIFGVRSFRKKREAENPYHQFDDQY